jgi:chaperonin GroES
MIKPLSNRVLVQRITDAPKHPMGIILPSTPAEDQIEGTVLAVGPGRLLDNGTVIAPVVAVGDRILFTKFSGAEVRHEDKDYLILREDDIMAILGG